jgi:uncharacterized membrane protein YeaQ/YmgE (transglycosylase-associated protein family)
MHLSFYLALGLIIGLFGYVIDPGRKIENLVGTTLLGIVGSLQGYLIGNLLQTIPVIEHPPSTLFLAFMGGMLLLSIKLLTKKAF